MSSVRPNTMKAIELLSYPTDLRASDLASHFRIADVPVPEPKSGEVLVKLSYSPINPSDMMTMKGMYDSENREPLPSRIGNEGSGVVVATGGGLLPYFVKGKRVAVIASNRMYGQYAVVPALFCFPLPDNVSLEQGACTFVNPLTVVSMIDLAKSLKVKAILHTAAASALGKMLVRYGDQNGVEVVCVVRRSAQVEILKEVGARYIVNTEDEDWEAKLKELCTQLKVTLGFDAIGGPMSAQFLTAMPNESTLHVYGCLSEAPVSNLNVQEILFKGKTLAGFHVKRYLDTKGLIGKKSLINKVMANLSGSLRTDIGKVFDLEDLAEAVQYNLSKSEKVLIRCQPRDRVVVLGSSGNVGQATLSALAQHFSEDLKIVAGVRNPEKASQLAGLNGVSLAQADMGNVDATTALLKNTSSVFIITPGSQERTAIASNAIKAAVAAQVGHVLLVSVSTVAQTEKSLFGRQFQSLEEELKASGLNYTIIRLPIFIDNNFGNAATIKDPGAIYGPANPTAVHSPVAVKDVGEAAAKILLKPDAHFGKTYDFVSEQVTHEQVAAAFSRVLGREIQYTQVPYENAKDAILGLGLEEWQVDGILELYRLIDEGDASTSIVSGDLESVLGRKPTTVEQWAQENAAAFQ